MPCYLFFNKQFLVCVCVMYDVQGSMDEESTEDTDGSPKKLFIFGGGDNEGSFFSDLLTLTMDELN